MKKFKFTYILDVEFEISETYLMAIGLLWDIILGAILGQTINFLLSFNLEWEHIVLISVVLAVLERIVKYKRRKRNA